MASNVTSAPLDPALETTSRRETLQKLADDLDQRSAQLSGLRGVLFLVALFGSGYGAYKGLSTLVWAVLGLVWLLFVFAVAWHGSLVTREMDVKLRLSLLDRSLLRLSGKLPEALPGAPLADPRHPYAVDLDVFGPSSVFRLLDETRTAPGTLTLATWLSMPASPDEILSRQEACQELAKKRAFREDLAALGASSGTRGKSVDGLIAWAEAPAVLATSADRFLSRAAFVLVPLTVLLFVATKTVADYLPPFLMRAYLVPFAFQLVILFSLVFKLQPALTQVGAKESPFGRYRAIFKRIEEETFESPRLRSLAKEIVGASGERRASEEFASFERILGFVELRHNGLVHLAANVFLLWDVFCIVFLERFRARAGKRVRGFFSALGELEALGCLGTFAYEHPTFVYPKVEPGGPRFVAEGLGHPLIPNEKRKGNDVCLAEPGRGLLVTGSNMSGKSTWLRSMGLGAVLAQAGAPVCAKKLEMTPLAVRTSMRISDSLEQGVSHFYAELEKLKAVVDAANAGEPLFFLLDEVLHGTNSRERHLGARAVVQHVLGKQAIGALTSHDLALSDLEERTGGRVINVHFQEHVEGGRMTFDYVLRPGVVSTTNALRLMRLVGIAVDLPELAGEATLVDSTPDR